MRRDYRRVTLDLEDDHWWYRGRRHIVNSVIGTLGLDGSIEVLDTGCGGGAGLPDLAALGSVVAVEPDPEARAAAASRGAGEVVDGTIEALPFASGRFDLVTAFDVLEHLDDDVAGLNELSRVVKPGGHLVATVPAQPRLWSSHDVENEHRRRYVRASFIQAAERAQWTSLFVSYFNFVLFGPAAVSRVLSRPSRARRSDFEQTPRWADGSLERILALEARALARRRRLPTGLSLIGVFQAPLASS